MTSYIESLMRDVFQAEGADNAERLAKLAAQTLEAVAGREKVDRLERDARVYELSGKMPINLVAVRVGMTRMSCYNAIKRIRALKRAA